MWFGWGHQQGNSWVLCTATGEKILAIRLFQHPSVLSLSQLTDACMSARLGLCHRQTRYHSSQMTASLTVMLCWCVTWPLPGTNTQSVGCARVWSARTHAPFTCARAIRPSEANSPRPVSGRVGSARRLVALRWQQCRAAKAHCCRWSATNQKQQRVMQALAHQQWWQHPHPAIRNPTSPAPEPQAAPASLVHTATTAHSSETAAAAQLRGCSTALQNTRVFRGEPQCHQPAAAVHPAAGSTTGPPAAAAAAASWDASCCSAQKVCCQGVFFQLCLPSIFNQHTAF